MLCIDFFDFLYMHNSFKGSPVVSMVCKLHCGSPSIYSQEDYQHLYRDYHTIMRGAGNQIRSVGATTDSRSITR